LSTAIIARALPAIVPLLPSVFRRWIVAKSSTEIPCGR
jgi:hypothetical protein